MITIEHQGIVPPRVYAEQFGAVGDGVTDDYQAFVDAAAYLNAAGGGIIELLPNQPYRIGTNWTATANITIRSFRAGRLVPDNGVTIQINGEVDAGKDDVFDTSLGGVVLWQKSPVVRPEWFGAAVNGATDDYAAWTRTIAAVSASGGGVILFAAGQSHLDTGIVVPSGVMIVGDQSRNSVFTYDGTASAVTFSAGTALRNGGLKDLTIQCTAADATVRALSLLTLGELMVFERITLLGAGGGRGLSAVGESADWIVRGMRIEDFAYDFVLERDGTGAPEMVRVYDLKLHGAATEALRIYRASGNVFHGVRVNDCPCTGPAIHILGDESAGANLQGVSNELHGVNIDTCAALAGTYHTHFEECRGNKIFGLRAEGVNGTSLHFGANAHYNEVFGFFAETQQAGNVTHNASSHDNVVLGHNVDYTNNMGHAARSAVIEMSYLSELDMPLTATADDATPTVRGCRVLYLPSGTGAWAITNLDNGRIGQIVSLVVQAVANIPTIADAGNFKLSAAWAPATDGTLTLYYDGTSWIELARSAN